VTSSPLQIRAEALAEPDERLFNRDFLLTWSHDEATIRFVVQAAAVLEELVRTDLSATAFDSGLGVAIFRDKSTRTRYAFRAACNLLGLGTEELDESSSQIAHGETVRETAAMIGFLTEAIGIRDDIHIGHGHAYMQEVAAAVDEAFLEGTLAQRPAVINLQSDLDHPTQSLADLCHLAATFGGLDGLRGRKLAMSWAYSPSYGKPLSVPQATIALATRFGMDVVLAHPPGYDLLPEPLAAANRFATDTGGSFRVTDDMADAFDGADVVYPKSWAPLAIMQERSARRRSGQAADLADLERAALAENARHRDWECNETLMRRTREGRARYMHCLPADVSGVNCAEGEVSRGVFERARLDTYREASYKPFVVAALILLTRRERPAATVQYLASRARPRRRA
jgi:knotted carbamoyltransferase YgeW